jgi:hypothetical protein
MDEDLLISMGTAIILSTVKNPKKRRSLKKIMLKIFNSIRAAYAGDPDFE